MRAILFRNESGIEEVLISDASNDDLEQAYKSIKGNLDYIVDELIRIGYSNSYTIETEAIEDLISPYLEDEEDELEDGELEDGELEDEVEEVPLLKTYYLTFGSNHEPGINCFQRVLAIDYEEARDIVIDRYGLNWSMLYTERDWFYENSTSQADKWGLKEGEVIR